jgi:hypothetical protein
MDGDQFIVLLMGFMFLVIGVGFLFVSTDERAEERDRKRGWLLFSRNNFFSPYFIFFQIPWYKWVVAIFNLALSAIFIAYAFGLLDRFL